MRIGLPPTLAASLVAALGLAAVAFGDQARLVRPATSPVAPSALVADIQRQFDALERSIETMYAKLIQEAKSERAALEDRIRQLNKEIDTLKAQASRIESSGAAERNSAQAGARIKEINDAIESRKKSILEMKDRIKALDQEIAKLQTEKEKVVAELRKQKARLLELAANAGDQGATAAVQAAARDILATLQAQTASRPLPTRTPATTWR